MLFGRRAIADTLPTAGVRCVESRICFPQSRWSCGWLSIHRWSTRRLTALRICGKSSHVNNRPRAPAAPDEDLLRAVDLVLRPLARMFVEQGLVFPTVEELLKAAYIRVAESEFGLAGESPSDSRISVLSGVHRKDVRRLRTPSTEPAPAEVSLPFASEVVTRWVSDRRFRTAKGKPRILPRSADGPEPSFDALVAGISTDVRPKVLLDELLRLGVVRLTAERDVELLMGAFVPQKNRRQRLFYLGRNLHDHIAACVHNLADREPSMMEQSVFSFELSASSVADIAEQARREWQTVLERLIPAIGQCEERDRAAGATSMRMNIGMYFFHESADSPASHGMPVRRRAAAPTASPRNAGQKSRRTT